MREFSDFNQYKEQIDEEQKTNQQVNEFEVDLSVVEKDVNVTCVFNGLRLVFAIPTFEKLVVILNQLTEIFD